MSLSDEIENYRRFLLIEAGKSYLFTDMHDELLAAADDIRRVQEKLQENHSIYEKAD